MSIHTAKCRKELFTPPPTLLRTPHVTSVEPKGSPIVANQRCFAPPTLACAPACDILSGLSGGCSSQGAVEVFSASGVLSLLMENSPHFSCFSPQQNLPTNSPLLPSPTPPQEEAILFFSIQLRQRTRSKRNCCRLSCFPVLSTHAQRREKIRHVRGM